MARSDEPARFPWEEDTEELGEFLWRYGYHKVRDFEGVWQLGPDGQYLTRREALVQIAERLAEREDEA